MFFGDSCLYVFQPFVRRVRIFLSDYFYDVSILELGKDLRHFTIYLGTRNMLADVRMYRISKVHRTRVFWQVDDITLWSKNKNSVVEKVHFQMFHKILRFLMGMI